MTENQALLRSKRSQILQIASRYGVEHLRVFGSVARGLVVWIIHHIEIIGEAASKISGELREKYPMSLLHKVFNHEGHKVYKGILKVPIQNLEGR